MMWLTVTVSVFTITSAIKILNEDVKTVIHNSPVPFTRLSINSNNDANNRTPYLPRIKKYDYLDNPKTRSRPSNLEKAIPNFKPNFQDFNVLIRHLDGDRTKALSTLQESKPQKGKKREADSDDDFVPTQLLAQTRQSDNDQHLPLQEHEPHLREAIKDTKIHIEYTEDGYEDIGYDHADEEQHEENNARYRSNQTKGQTQVDVEKEFENYDKNYDEVGEETQEKISRVPVNPKRKARFTENNEYLTLNTKYPYYKSKVLDKNSALRYASNLKNIPKKIQDELSFYKHTGAFKCNKIPLNINPLPSTEHTSASSIVSGPRLKNLGEKIMCLTTKYFGVNPLDNPLFSETNIETPQPFPEMRRIKRSLTTDAQLIKKNDLDEALPESSPLRLRKRRRKYPLPLQRPAFFGSSYYSTSRPPVTIFLPTIVPKYKTISEVYYKDEIQPNEQLNVFADVMNNIKQIKTDLIGADTELAEDQTVPYETKSEKNKVKIRVPTKKIKIRQSSVNLPEAPTFTTTTTTTEKIQTRRRNKIKNHKTDPQVYEEYLHTIKTFKEKKPEESSKIKQPLNEETENGLVELEFEEVIGLSPPTVEFPKLKPASSSLPPRTILNTFPVSGMKPPVNRNPLVYSDFKRFKNKLHVIRKRSPQKPAYSEIRRTKTQQSTEVEDDDYVPNRNRNFRYDTDTKQVVYTKPETNENAEETDSEEPVTVKTVVAKIRPTKSPTTSTTIQTGPSFLDYVHQLKSSKQYQHIMEPTEKPKEVNATTTTTEQYTTSQTNSERPDYLKIVSNLKQNDGYVAIPEKAKTTTTEMPKIEEHIEDFQELQIFDITEYLPKQDVPAVTINYSKYKTIQRKPVKHDENMASSEQESVITDPSTETTRTSTKSTTTTTEAILTTTRKVRMRTRRRPGTTTTTEQYAEATSAPPRQTRRRFRSTTQATTEASSETTSSTQQIKRRRLPIRSLSVSPKLPSNHKQVYTPIKGLDLVPIKEETSTEAQKEVSEKASKFYSDPNLPKSVNQLKELVKHKHENVTQSDHIKEIQPKTEEPNLSKIRIIKDPSKRLYYYAPIH